jgi:hypothetical protein
LELLVELAGALMVEVVEEALRLVERAMLHL